MLGQALKNIFKPEQAQTSYCTVVQRVNGVRYKLTDETGRTVYAESTDYYPAGVAVLVNAGRITGRGNLAGTHRIYEV